MHGPLRLFEIYHFQIIMASVRKKGRYDAHDLLDEFLLNQVAKHVRYLHLSTFARDLGIRQEEYDRITAPNTFTQDEQIHRVISLTIYTKNTKTHLNCVFVFNEIICLLTKCYTRNISACLSVFSCVQDNI